MKRETRARIMHGFGTALVLTLYTKENSESSEQGYNAGMWWLDAQLLELMYMVFVVLPVGIGLIWIVAKHKKE